MSLSLTKYHTKSPSKTKLGTSSGYFGIEERFKTTSTSANDISYDVQPIDTTKSVIFPSSVRFSPEGSRINGSSNGPGSYDVSKGYQFHSEYPMKRANRFATYPRQSMDMKTISPGAVYDTDKVYFNGPDKRLPITFKSDTRFPEMQSSISNTQLFIPKSETGPAITIAKRLNRVEVGHDSPGNIYNVNYQKRRAPAYSFGKGKHIRFKPVAFLPEPDD